MKIQNNNPLAKASTKSNLEGSRLQPDLPMLEVILQTKAEVEALSAQAGLKIIHHFLEEEVQQRCGPHGQQGAWRHGHQPGYVVFAGRKVSLSKPRLRAKDGGESWVALGGRYAVDLVCLVLAIGLGILVSIRRDDNSGRGIAAMIVLAAIVISGIHVAVTWARKVTLVLLNSEDSRVAEKAFGHFRRRTTMNEAITLVRSRRERGNVRFYAAVSISDMLLTNSAMSASQVLARIEGSPDIVPYFFDTNSINQRFSSGVAISPQVLIENHLGKRPW